MRHVGRDELKGYLESGEEAILVEELPESYWREGPPAPPLIIPKEVGVFFAILDVNIKQIDGRNIDSIHDVNIEKINIGLSECSTKS